MAGIYVHIPFCESRCLYCDFFSTTDVEKRERYVSTLLKEMELRRNELPQQDSFRTIYIGGGTPSQLSTKDLKRIFDGIYSLFDVRADAEVTMECNPEDMTLAFAEGLRTLPVNRISMGVQTFDDERLRFLHRRHNSQKAHEAVDLLKEAGYQNISIDLMFGFPGEQLQEWEKDIEKGLSLDVPHLSAYSLMYEEGTALTKLKESGMITALEDDEMLDMYALLMNKLEESGYNHYEISNFCKPGMESRHNMSYWQGESYMGFGAGAHSYNGIIRKWNIASLDHYMEGVMRGTGYSDYEILSDKDRLNEYVMTRLRTIKGMDLEQVRNEFADKTDLSEFERVLSKHLDGGNLIQENGIIRLSRKGLYISDTIMSDLFEL